MPSINRKNKDKLFTYIFGKEQNKQWILDLYNAINGSSYENPDDIEINTMSDVLYMGMINDVSFIVQDILSLYAHQSTFNPNMPLRELMYAASLYDKYVHQHNLNIYSSKQIKIPVPRIVVFYNGMRDIEDEIILELKDAFPEGSDPERSDIQVRVRMLNINYGHNNALLSKCRPLMEYSWFVERVRINRDKGMSIEKAVDKTL
ncbi:MAG: hypothetical protein J6P16_01185, partial [Eubacterium sp.]|nr:hypothetical protein [Eubacterium sp.]